MFKRLHLDGHRRIPLWPHQGGRSTSTLYLEIIDGNTAYSAGATTFYGVKRSASLITTVPTLYDPTAFAATPGAFTAIDGIGRARLRINGTIVGFVLVCHDPTGPITVPLLQASSVVATATKSIPLASDATQAVTAYIPEWR